MMFRAFVLLAMLIGPTAAHAGANSMQSSLWSLAWACENREAFSERDREMLGRVCGELGYPGSDLQSVDPL